MSSRSVDCVINFILVISICKLSHNSFTSGRITQTYKKLTLFHSQSFVTWHYGKSQKKKPQPKEYKEKVSIDTGFHETMKLLAHHANTKGTAEITYKNRNRDKQENI
jgi:hypothetical protein